MVAVWALAADDQDEAERLAASSRMAMALLRRGQPSAIPPVDKALRYLAEYGGSDAARSRRAILGRAKRCARASSRSPPTTTPRRSWS